MLTDFEILVSALNDTRKVNSNDNDNKVDEDKIPIWNPEMSKI